MTRLDRLAAGARPPWARVLRAAVVVLLAGVVALAVTTPRTDWSWSDVSDGPQVVALSGHAVAPASSGQRGRDPLWALAATGVALVAVVLVVGIAPTAPVGGRSASLSLGPPGRGPPPSR